MGGEAEPPDPRAVAGEERSLSRMQWIQNEPAHSSSVLSSGSAHPSSTKAWLPFVLTCSVDPINTILFLKGKNN